MLKKTVKICGRVVGFCLRTLGSLGKWTAVFTWRNRKSIKKISGGALNITKGIADGMGGAMVQLAAAIIYSNKRLQKLTVKIKSQSREYQHILEDKAALLDAGIIGGTLVTEVVSGTTEVDPEIISAYETAFPDKAALMSFEEAVRHSSGDELQGLLAGVKGKLFEIQYVEALNDHLLPDGYSAFLADSPTQPGYDILVNGPDGNLAQVFQLKATDSVDYIKEAFQRYPDIDIVSTDEVYSKLILHLSDQGDLINSGISNMYLEEMIDTNVSIAQDGTDISLKGLPLLSLALIAFSAYTEKDMNLYQRSYNFGFRGVKALLAYNLGKACLTVTGVCWVGLMASVGFRLFLAKGERKINYAKQLKQIIRNNKRVIKELKMA